MIAQHLLNVFTNTDIEKIQNVLLHVKNQRHGKYEKIFTNGFTKSDPVYELIRRWVIEPLNRVCQIKIKKINVGMRLISREPFPIHSDSYGKGDSGEGQAYLIPLSQRPIYQDRPMQQSHTIIFDQSWAISQQMEDYISSAPQMPHKDVDDMWQDHFDHNPRHWSRYLSLKLLAPWIPGSVITWDRKLLHTSDNFIKKNILERTALVIFATGE